MHVDIKQNVPCKHFSFSIVFLLLLDNVIQYGAVGFIAASTMRQHNGRATQAMRRFRANISFLSLYLSLVSTTLSFCFVMSRFFFFLFSISNMNSNSRLGGRPAANPGSLPFQIAPTPADRQTLDEKVQRK